MTSFRATAVFQQAHYDWTQTRFEDLTASRANLAALAENLRATAKTYAQSDAQAAKLLFKILYVIKPARRLKRQAPSSCGWPAS